MRRYRLTVLALTASLFLAACGGGDGGGSTDEIISSRSVPTATLPARLPTPLIVGSEGFRPPTELIGTIGGRGAYTIQSGDTFSTIAQANGVTVQDLLDANGLSANTILRVGEKLIIPAPNTLGNPSAPGATSTAAATRTATAGATATRAAGARQTYIVQAGDNASVIAGKFGVTVQDLARANNMTMDQIARLSIGQQLIIP